MGSQSTAQAQLAPRGPAAHCSCLPLQPPLTGLSFSLARLQLSVLLSFSVSRLSTCCSFCLGCSLPLFPYTRLLCVLRTSDLLPLLREFLLIGDLPQQLSATPLSVSFIVLTAVCHDFVIPFVCLLTICLPSPVDLSSLKAVALSVWFIHVSPVPGTVRGMQEALDI